MFEWIQFSAVATASAGAFYLFVGCQLFPPIRKWTENVLCLPSPSTKHEIAVLDVYRGGAAALVTMAHIWVFAQPIFNSTQTQWWHCLAVGGNKAVPIFVILSGLLIFRSVKKIRTDNDLRRYVQRRFLRIYPTYFFTLLLAYLVGQIKFDWPNFISQFFMIRAICPAHLQYINPPTWSLYVEVLFYAVLPVWFAGFRNKPLTASFMSFGVLLFMDHLASRELWIWKYFFVGIIVSELSERYARYLSETKGILLFALGCFLLYLDFKTSPNGAPYDWFNLLHLVPKNLAEYTIGLSLASALILIGSLNAPRLVGYLSIKPLRMLGAISYSLFLIHPFFILAVFPKFDFTKAAQVQVLTENSPVAPPWYAPFVMFPGCLAWAIFCFLIIERPFLLLRPKQALVSGDSLSS